MRNLFLCLCLLVLTTGCAPLHMQHTDSVGVKVAKGFARVPVALLTFGLSEGWHATERKMASRLGREEIDLIMVWGIPQAVWDDGTGGRILAYTQDHVYVQPGTATTNSTANGSVIGNQIYVYGQSRTTYAPPQVHKWQTLRQFRVDSRGTIIQYSWRGL